MDILWAITKTTQHSSHILIVLQALYWAQGDLIVNKINGYKELSVQ